MELLFLFWMALCGSVIWFLPTSATSIYYGSQLGWNPLFVGFICAIGQTLGYVFLFFCGKYLVHSWKALALRIQATRDRYEARIEKGILPIAFLGGVTGVPPMVGLATLAPAFGAPLPGFLALAFLGRWIRFSLMASVGHALTEVLQRWFS